MAGIKEYFESRYKFLHNHIDDLLNASFDGIVIVDADGKVLFANRSHGQLTGLESAIIVGEKLQDLIKAGILEGAVALDVLKTKAPMTRMHLYIKSGKTAMVTASPVFDNSGALSFVIVNLRDITQLNKWYEDIGYSIKNDSDEEPIYIKCDIASLPDYGILIQNHRMKDCLNKAVHVATFDTPVLIMGESGCGKTKLAEIIHNASTRSKGPFISVNCGSIPENLLESEFYGYEKGAFTGANSQGKKGFFELAAGGTLVLDEIGELSIAQQVKLLKAIEEHRIYKVGGGNPIDVDIRIIAVSNRDLKSMVKENLFRKDLFFRLNVVQIVMPPLRERLDEIPALAKYFFNEFNNKFGMAKYPRPDLIRRLCQINYQGNVRELKNLIERLVIMAPNNAITVDDFKSCYSDLEADPFVLNRFDQGSLQQVLDNCERDTILKVIEETVTINDACSQLGISKASFWRKIKKHNIIMKRNAVLG